MYQNQNKGNDMSEMLADILKSKPNFGGDVFGGPVFQSKWKWLLILWLYLNFFTWN